MITVHHAPNSRSCRVVWALEELGVPYRTDLKAFTPESLKAPAYLAKNPLGKVPTIEDGEVVLFESGAIVQYLLERYGDGRLEPRRDAPERPAYLQWFHWAEATMVQPLGEIAQHSFVRPEEDRIPQIVPDAMARLATILDALEQALAGRQYIAGDTFTAADIMLGYSVHLATLLGQVGEQHGQIKAYHERLAQRPAFQKAFPS